MASRIDVGFPTAGIAGRPAWQWLLFLYLVGFSLQLLFGLTQTLSLAFAPIHAFARPWTWVTSLFMHGSFMHLFFNAFALLMFAPLLEGAIGTRRFVYTYMTAGLVGNLFYYLINPASTVPGLGASGAIFGVLGAIAVLAPNLPIYIFYVIPVPMWIATIFWVVTELSGALGPDTGIGHAAHLGGLFFGLVYIKYLQSSTHAHRAQRQNARQTLYPGGGEEPIVMIDPNAPKEKL